MKNVLCIFLACVLLSALFIPPACAAANINVFSFLYYYGEFYYNFSEKKNVPSSYFCYPSGSQGIYTNSDVSLLVFFSCEAGSSFRVSSISCSGESGILYQLMATTMTVKALAGYYSDVDKMSNEAIDAAYEIFLLQNGESYTCKEFTVTHEDGSYVFSL